MAHQPAQRPQEALESLPRPPSMPEGVQEAQTASGGVVESPVTAPQPQVRPKPHPRVKKPEPEAASHLLALRNRLIAALRPRMTATEAAMTAEQLLPDVVAYGLECAVKALHDQDVLVAQMVSAAQDCLEILAAEP